MNEEEIERLYEDLSDLYGVPMPVYIFYERRPKVEYPMEGLRISISRKIGGYFILSEDVAVDIFGFILLSKGTKGIRKDEAVHEFLHYYDYLTGARPSDEESVRYRTGKYMRTSRAISGA